MAFHLQLRFTLGGFTGVDIFFVISGYLITSIVLADLRTGRFTMREFYVRRIRRIFPALVAVLLGTAAAALVFCLPSELIDFSKSLIAVSLSSSNLYFGTHSTYFEPMSFLRPLLHTWSLGVEEQFYLFLPPLLLLFWTRARRWLPLLLAVLAVASFAASAVQSVTAPAFAFFMPWTRACELLWGALLAAGVVPRMRSPWARNAAAALGLLLVAASFLLINGAMNFPGFTALIPCGGAALLIWSGQPHRMDESSPLPPPTLVARFLAARPLVFIGLISYSLYLWHWPVIVFQGISLWGDDLPHRVMKAILVALSFALAILTWRFVERPFRDGPLRLAGAGAFRFAAVSSLALVALGFAGILLHGLPARFPADAVAVGNYVDEPVNYRLGTCMVLRVQDFKPDPCLREDPTKPNWLLIGDSHAAAQWQGLVKAFPGVHFLQVSSAACRPAPDRTEGPCGTLSQLVFHQFLLTHHIDRMVFVGRWVSTDIPELDRTVAWTREHGIPLTVIGPTQDYDDPLPRLLAYGIMRHDAGFANRHRLEPTAVLDKQFAALARDRWHVPYISLVDMFCSDGGCRNYVNGQGGAPLLVDGDHLSNEGSMLAGQRIAEGHLLP